jgi:hypothetical protein
MNKVKAGAATVDSRAAWIVAGVALAILMIAYGAPLLSAVALKPIAAEFGTERAAASAAGAFTLVGAAFGGIAAGWRAGSASGGSSCSGRRCSPLASFSRPPAAWPTSMWATAC